MKYEITRDVIGDLWPLVRGDEASADSRALVDGYLAHDSAYAAELQRSENMTAMPPVHLSPDAERRLLDDARDHARKRLLLIGAGVALGGAVLMTALLGALFFIGRI